MYYCDKCGERIHDLSKPCPTCGMYINSNINTSYNKEGGKKTTKILIGIIIIVGIVFIGLSLINSINSYAVEDIDFRGNNYSFYYNDGAWLESDLSTDEYYILQNNNDLNAYLQFPVNAVEFNLNLDSNDVRDSMYSTYKSFFSTNSEYYYHNIMSEFKILNNTNNYYLTADFYKNDDVSIKGKIFIISSPTGKTISVLLKKGSKDIADIEDDVFDILKEVKL